MSDTPAPPPPPPGAPPPPPPGAAAVTSAGNDAGFGTRLVAAIVDWLVVGIPSWIITQVGVAAAPTELDVCSDGFGICEVPTGAGWVIIGFSFLVAIGGAIAYYGYLDGERGQTLGKRVANIKVVDANSGATIGVGRGVGRWFAKILSGMVCFLGYLWMLWDPQKQTWHDKIVTTRVVTA